MPDDARSAEITAHLIHEMGTYPVSVVQRAAKKFGVTRQAVLKRLNVLIEQGDVVASGNTKGRKYTLKQNIVAERSFDIAGLQEDIVYRNEVRPKLGDLPDSVQRICHYGFTEILNNAIDHSMSDTVTVIASRTPHMVDFIVQDYGVGIFRKIKNALGLEDERQSLIHLGKGKMTTDAERHSGQGIYFTSRVFDHFAILSGKLFFWHSLHHDDWLAQDEATEAKGTYVRMRICTLSRTKLNEVFDKYSTVDERGFSRTHVPICLAQYGNDGLVSRSQAKRVLQLFEQFEEVLLDFKGVETIGQAFADEIFRVFRRNNPQIRVHWINDTEQVATMIQRATDQLVSEIQKASEG